MIINQIEYVEELKAELAAVGFTSVKEWLPNQTPTLLADYECFIVDNTPIMNGPRLETVESSFWNVFLCIKKTLFTDQNIVSLKKTQEGYALTAVYNSFENSTTIESSKIQSITQLNEDDYPDFTTNYYVFSVNFNTVFVNEY